MSFIFRTIFWLSIACVVIPPESRLGGDEEVEWREIDLALELHDAAYALWGFSVQLANICDINPELCFSATALMTSTSAPGSAVSPNTPSRSNVNSVETTGAPTPPQKKVQARVE